MSRRARVTTMVVAATLLAATTPATAGAASAERSRVPVVQEFNDDGTPASGSVSIGWSQIIRTDDSLRGVTTVSGLSPGGVYTFWLIAVQSDGTFPDDVFVSNGGGTVVGSNGKATVAMAAEVGDASISGFRPGGGEEIRFADLVDTRHSIVRVEIAYHGQVAEAGDDLDTWLSDFWTGSACPPDTPNPNPLQPHCPVLHAATHS